MGNTEIKKIDVKIYFSTFCTYQVEAQDEAEAILKARGLPIDEAEILTNLKNWEEADEAELVS